MAIPSGLAGQIGFKVESSYGTAVAVDRFVPFISTGFTENIEYVKSQAVRAGRQILHSTDVYTGRTWISGGFATDLHTRSIGPLFLCALGANSTTGAGPYTHTLTPAELTGDSLTIQAGIPDTGGTVNPFTFTGCKVNTLTLSANAGEICGLEVDVLGQALSTSTTLQSASYGSGLDAFMFTEATVTLASSSVTNVESFTLEINNGFEPRHFLAAASTAQPLQKTWQTITGTLEMEFDGLTDYNRFRAATQAALVLAFSDGSNSITATMNVYFSGTTPQLNGPDIVKISQPFEALGSTDAAACTIVMVNGDSTL